MEMAIKNQTLVFLPLREKKRSIKRVFEIDAIRGLLIILMVLDHIAYDFGLLMPDFFILAQGPQWLQDLSIWSEGYWFELWRINIRYVVIALFYILIGLSSYFSRNSLKRGMLLLGFGSIISIVAYIGSLLLQTNMFIFFGIISCLGVSLILYSLLRLFFLKTTGSKKAWKWIALFLSLLFLGTGYWMRIDIASATLTSSNWWLISNGRLTPVLNTYTYVGGVFTPIEYDAATKWAIIIGQYWYGVDWAGLFPYMGYAFLGGFIGEALYASKKSLIFKKESHLQNRVEKIFKPLTFIGSKTIYIYLLHQVVLAGLAFLVFLLAGTPLK